jgi:hypothetical protein
MATICLSREELANALKNEKQVVLLLSGDDPGMSEIVQRADDAILLPEIQAAVWVKDRTLVADYASTDPDVVACALSVPTRRVCAFVPRAKALTTFFARALKEAKQGTKPPVIL